MFSVGHPLQRGFTLLESLVVLFMIGVLSVVASHRLFIAQDRSGHLVSVLRYARQMALLSHQRVVVCGYGPKGTCSRDWSQGFLVKKKLGSIVLYQWQSLASGCRIQLKQGSVSASQVVFNRAGLSPGSQGRFDFLGPACRGHYRVVVSPCGRARIRKV